jgi:hypothetical protein
MINLSAHDGIVDSFGKEISSFKKIIKSVDDGVVALGSTPEAQTDNFES